MGIWKLSDSDYRLMHLVWANEPIRSGELVKLCAEKNHWEKSTTYTMIKKLSEKGLLENKESVVRSLITKEEIQSCESKRILKSVFDNSLPRFVSAFLHDGKLTGSEAEEIMGMIQAYQK